MCKNTHFPSHIHDINVVYIIRRVYESAITSKIALVFAKIRKNHDICGIDSAKIIIFVELIPQKFIYLRKNKIMRYDSSADKT